MKNNKPGKFRTMFLYFNAALLIMVLGAGTYYVVSLYSKAQSCFTRDEVQQSSKCLYIYQNSVYEKGTRDAPHQGNPCGSDVTALIPNSHMLDKVGHLDPNYQGELCSNTPQPTATPVPTATDTPVPTATQAPTNTQAPSPTTGQSSNPTATPTTPPIGGAPISTATPTVRVSSTITPTTRVLSTATPTMRPTSSSTDSAMLETETPEPTGLTTLPVTGRLEWVAVALIPLSLVIIGVIF